jgi:ABC-type amino acid transport substrate-binding protein
MLLALLAACARPSAPAVAPTPASHLDLIRQAGVLRVGISADAPPFAFIDRQGERQGFDIELVSGIARRMGVEIEWAEAAYNRLPELVQSGKVDLAIGGIACSAGWEGQVEFSRPYYQPAQPAPPGRGALCILLPLAEPTLAGRLNQIIGELEREGVIDKLEVEHLAPGE